MENNYFLKVYQDNYVGMCHFSYMICKDEECSKDITQQVILSVLEKTEEELSNIKSLKNYLFGSVRLKTLQYLRDQKTRSELLAKHVETTRKVDQIRDFELEEIIKNSIQSLPTRAREVFLLKREIGLSISEISERLQISKKTVESHMTLALKRLKVIMNAYV